MISLRGICDQRQAGSNWRSVPDWEVKYPLPLPLACKGWGVRWERLKVGAVSVGPGGAALNRHDGEVSSVSCCPEVRARAKGGRQISDLEDSPLGGLQWGREPSQLAGGVGPESGRGAELTQEFRAHQQFFEDGETRPFIPLTRNMYVE